jgi:2-isopropylmalate synthase
VKGARVAALARAVPKDVEAAAEALRGAEAPRIHVFVNASDVQLAHQLRTTREKVVGMVAAMVARARDLAGDVEFSPMDATRADREFVAELAETALRAGARTINLPDTVGFARPGAVEALFVWVRERVPELAEGAVLSFHGQDDLGLATANSLAAIAGGARQVEVAVNGIGERAGNTAFEEVVMAIRVHGEALGVATGVDARAIHELSRLVAERSRIAVPPNKAVVGANAFRHASGIHQDGVLKHRATFECFDPAEIGHPEGTQIVLGKLSGRAGFGARAAQLGLPLEGRALARAFARFQALAASGAPVGDDEVRAACAEALAMAG